MNRSNDQRPMMDRQARRVRLAGIQYQTEEFLARRDRVPVLPHRMTIEDDGIRVVVHAHKLLRWPNPGEARWIAPVQTGHQLVSCELAP